MVLSAASSTSVTLERPGESEPLQLPLQLSGSPVRIGIKWREDQADPGSLLLTNVVPGSAAGLALLQPRDRVYAINGQSFSGSQEFLRLITTLEGPIDLLVERNGKLRTASLELWDGDAADQVDAAPTPTPNLD